MVMKNKKGNIFPSLGINTPLKLSLCYYSTINQSTEVNANDPIYKLLYNYSELETIIKMNEGQITKFLYFNRKLIDKILYNSNKIIHFKYEKKVYNISFYFYLILLIKDNPEILNYSLDLEFIEHINKKQKQNKDAYNALIMAKIIIDLINDYRETNDCFGEKIDENLNKIITDNKSIINNFINVLEEINIKWDINFFLSKSIDEIYIEIINSMIKTKKLNNCTYILEQLDIENINLTKNMVEKISETLKNYIISYKLNEENINFYILLIDYIFKNNIYIYQIQFLIETTKKIKILLKKNGISFHNIQPKDLKEKIKYINNNTGKQCKKKRKSKIFEIFQKSYENFENYSSNINNNEKNKEKNKEKEKENSQFIIKKSVSQPIGRKKTKIINKDEDVQENFTLKYLSYLYKLIQNPTLKNETINIINSLNYSKDYDNIIDKLDIKNKKERELFKKILIHKNFEIQINDSSSDYKSFLQNIFCYTTNDEIKDLKDKLPCNANSYSIKCFKEWLSKEKESIINSNNN